jgi:glycosyltransferase involved in cell wall biosynthesis
MRIAFIVEPWHVVYPKDDGGGASLPMMTYQLVRRLTDMKNEVVIYSKQASGQPLEEMDRHGICHRRIDLQFEHKLMRPLNILDRLQFHLLGRTTHLLWTSSFLFYAGYWRQIGNDLAQWKPDIVHIHDFSQFVPVVRRIVPKARIVIHMNTEWLSQWNAGMIRRRLREADLIIGCCEYITRKIRQRFPEFSDRCQTMYNGTDTSRFSPSEDLELQKTNSRVISFAGRLFTRERSACSAGCI